jgi:magnesium transporter
MRVAEALEEIRKTGHNKKTIDVAYVVAADGTFIKELHLASLVMANPNQLVTEIDDPVLGVVQDKDVLEDVIASFKKHNCAALPVVDSDNRILGIITFDDVMKAANATATRDIQKFGGMEALDAPYFSVRIRAMLRKRGGWLAFLFLGETLTATAMGHFEKEIASAVVLALFVPLIISSGGNSGWQATSLLIRSLALGEMSIRDWWKVGTARHFLA